MQQINAHFLPLQTWWMMQAYTSDSWLPSTELQRATRLLYLIQTEQLRPPPVARLDTLYTVDLEIFTNFATCSHW